MKKIVLRYIVVLLGLISSTLFAQMKERGLTRNGNEFVKDSLFVFAEAEYLKSLDILDFDTNRFNLAFAMLGQEKFDEAISEWEAVEKITENKILKSISAYNVATVHATQQKIDEAIEGYKQALRYFPKNDAARHNFWFLKLMKDQNPEPPKDQNKDDQNKDDQNKDDQNKDDQNKDEQNKDDQNKDKEKDQQDKKDSENESEDKNDSEDKSEEEKKEDEKSDEEKKEDESEDEGDEGDEKEEPKEPEDENSQPESESEGEPEPKEGELSKADALRLLESLDKEEDKTQEKIKAKLLKGKNNKKHEKDW